MNEIESRLLRTCLATRFFFLAFGLGISSWAPMVPFVKDRLEVDDSQLGLILLLAGVGAFISMPLGSMLIQRYGARASSLVSALSVIATLPLLAISSTVASVCAVLLLFGIGTGIWNVAINAQAVEVEAKTGRYLMSGFHCLFSTGGFFGAFIISGLLQLGCSLLFCALAVSLIMLTMVIFSWQHLLPPEAIRSRKEEKGGKNLSFSDKRVVMLGMLCLIFFLIEGSMLDWSAQFLHSSQDYGEDVAGIGYALFSIAMALGRFFGDRAIKRWGRALVFQTGSFLSAAGFLSLISLGNGYFELMGFCLIGLGASNIVPILFSATGDFGTKRSNFLLAFASTCGYVGLLAGPALIGLIAQAVSLSFAFLCMSFLLSGAGILGKYAGLTQRQEEFSPLSTIPVKKKSLIE